MRLKFRLWLRDYILDLLDFDNEVQRSIDLYHIEHIKELERDIEFLRNRISDIDSQL